MKIFSIIAAILALTSVVLGFISQNILLIVSSISIFFGFIFLYKYSENRSEKFMRIFAVFLGVYTVISLLRLFTEKGYF
jgi:hypothetical protein